MSGGRRRAKPAKPRRGPLLVALLSVLGAGVGTTAWVFLVGAAIDFGSDARSGDSAAWGFLAAATAGAIACLLMVLMLLGRAFAALGLSTARSRAAGSGGHHRR